jgi:hypothetical protein
VTKRIVYKRCSVTFDLATITKSKKLALEKAPSVSALLRLLVADAAEKEVAKKREPGRDGC